MLRTPPRKNCLTDAQALGYSIEAQLPPNIAPKPLFQAVQIFGGLSNPCVADFLRQTLQFTAQIRVTRHEIRDFMGQLQQVCQETIEHAEDIFKRFRLVLREPSGGRKNGAVGFSIGGSGKQLQNFAAQAQRFERSRLRATPGLPSASCAASLRSAGFQSLRVLRRPSISAGGMGANQKVRQRERIVGSMESARGASRI